MKRALAAFLLLLTTPAGCGIPSDAKPRDAESNGFLASRPPLVLDEGSATERLCFVRDGRLVRIARRVPRPVSAQQQLEALLAGPTTAEAGTGLTSTLTGTTATIQLTLAAGRATIEVGDRSQHGVRNDEILAFGQVVCTLASRPEIGTVNFTGNGKPLGVPRQDGSLTAGPLTVADYAQLIGS
jgi:spore germination protein GerM